MVEISLTPVIPDIPDPELDKRVEDFISKVNEESRTTVRAAINSHIVKALDAADKCDLLAVISNTSERGESLGTIKKLIKASSLGPMERELLLDEAVDMFMALDVHVALQLQEGCECKPAQKKPKAKKTKE